jgi:hypothetical protein
MSNYFTIKNFYLTKRRNSTKKGSTNMKAKFLITLALFTISINCLAIPAQKETLNELFKVTESRKMMDSAYGQMDVMFQQMAQGMNVTESQKPIMDKFFAKYSAMVKEELSWEKLETPIADAYSSVYTDDEVKEIIKFYKSPVGQKLLKKMPELMQATMGVMQKSMKDIMPKVQAIQKELADELAKDNAKKEK